MRAALALSAALLWSLPAWSQVITSEDDFESPRRFFFEFKLGPYSPNIDDDLSGDQTAFEHIFGDGSALMVKGEFDIQLFQRFGTLAIGGVFGWYRASAAAFADEAAGDATASEDDPKRTGARQASPCCPCRCWRSTALTGRP